MVKIKKSTAVLKIKDLSVFYGGNMALSGVNLTVYPGEYIFLVGGNGSGKSTLLKAVFGLVPVSGGTVSCSLPKNEMVYLPQINQAERDFPATVREVVLCGVQYATSSNKKTNKLFYTKDDRAAAEKAMEMFGVSSVAGKRIGELSGGQIQRVMLARAFCRPPKSMPKLLVPDEPCAGLDPDGARDVYEVLYRLNREHNTAIIMACHDYGQVEKYASRVISVDGNVVFDGTVSNWKRFVHENLCK